MPYSWATNQAKWKLELELELEQPRALDGVSSIPTVGARAEIAVSMKAVSGRGTSI
jgi:hypothetical protein